MKLTFEIPDAEAAILVTKLGDLNRPALEILAARGYRERILSTKQVRLLLGFDNCRETVELLAKLGVWPGLTVEEILDDAETASKFMTHEGS